MSSYTSLNTRLRASCLADVAARLQAGVDEAALMARASQVADQTLSAREVERLEAIVASLGLEVPAFASADRRAAVTGVAATAYRAAAQDFIVQSVLASIAEPGIAFGTPRVRRGADVVTIDARRGDSALLVRVDRDGHVERDWLVTEGEDCHVLDDELDRALRRRGLDFDVIVEDHHGGRSDEARLFGPALQRDAADPARGAVLDAERPVSSPAAARSADPAPPVRTRRTVRSRA